MKDNSRIIVVGASAGGVDALLRLAAALSPQLAAPILVVLHIGTHRSHLPELLNARGALRAQFAQNDIVPQAGRIYIAPPDRHLLLQDGALRLVSGPKEHHARPAINPLFRSAALDAGPRVVGVVLTGMLDDGSAGLRAIKECGGTAVVQDPQDAVEPSMPRSALAAVAADHVVEIEAMADLLDNLAQPLDAVPSFHAPTWLRVEHAVSLGDAGMKEIATIGEPSPLTCPDCGGALFEIKQKGPLRFLCHTGHAFSLRSLAVTHEATAEEALWSGVRALQERAAILRRLADQQAAEAPGSEAVARDEAEQAEAYAERLRAVISSAPGSLDPVGSPESEETVEEDTDPVAAR